MSNHNLDFDGLLPVDAFKKVGGRMSLHGGGGGEGQPPTSTTQTVLSYPPEVKPLVMKTLNEAITQASMPYQQYTGDRLAGFDPLQLTAQQGAANLRTSPSLDTATNMAQQVGLRGLQTNYDPMAYKAQQISNPQLQNYQMTGPANVNARALQNYQMTGPANVSTGSFTQPDVSAQYMSPYQQNVVDINKREALRQYGIQQAQLKGEATKSGAFGGGRQAILQNEANRSMNQNLADIQARGGQAAYEQAQGLYTAEAQRALAAAQANQNVGLQVGQENLGALLGVQQLGSSQDLAAQQANQATGLSVGQQNLAALLGVQQLGSSQSMTAQQANQQAALEAQRANEQSRQYGAGLQLQGNQQALAASQALGDLGATQFGQQQSIISGQNTAGAQRQALEQQGMGIDYENFLQQKQHPYQQIAFATEMMKAAPQQTTQAMYQAPPSLAAQLAGTAALAAGASKYYANGGLAGLGLYNMSGGEQ